jgi:hypothetical protein
MSRTSSCKTTRRNLDTAVVDDAPQLDVASRPAN